MSKGDREDNPVDPQEEAIQVFADVIRDLTSPDRDLKLILRRCQHACQLLSWNDTRDWFGRELNGYATVAEIPWYRKIQGRLIWRPESFHESYQRAVRDVIYGRPVDDPDRIEQEVILDVWSGIDFLLAASQSGCTEATGETKEGWSERRHRLVPLERVRVFNSANFARALAEIERLTFEFASTSYTFLRYGNVLTDFWADHRRQVDLALGQLNLTDHLDAIQSNLRSENPEAWRAAALGCRTVLSDVADYLWRDARDTYEHLAGSGPGKKLPVTHDRYANRLGAYLHQKGLGGTSGRFVRDEIERLAVSIRSLVDVQSKAKDAPISREDARSVALFTYLILGEIVTKTNIPPIEKYSMPAETPLLLGPEN